MRYEAIESHRDKFPITLICEVLGVSTSGYYGWRKRPISKRQQDNLVLLEEIKVVYENSSKAYGSPRIHRVLKDEGRMVGRTRVANLMRENGIQAIQKRKSIRKTDSKFRPWKPICQR